MEGFTAIGNWFDIVMFAELPLTSCLAHAMIDVAVQLILSWSKTVGGWHVLSVEAIAAYIAGTEFVGKVRYAEGVTRACT